MYVLSEGDVNMLVHISRHWERKVKIILPGKPRRIEDLYGTKRNRFGLVLYRDQ